MKYIGALQKCPIIPMTSSPDGADRYWIYMTSVGITKPGKSKSKLYAPSSSNAAGQPVFLDSGGTLSRLPTTLFNSIIADFPGATLASNGLFQVDCAVASLPGTMDFGFGSTVIHVPYHEFIWEAGASTCYIGLAADDTAPVLGDSFLRAAFGTLYLCTSLTRATICTLLFSDSGLLPEYKRPADFVGLFGSRSAGECTCPPGTISSRSGSRPLLIYQANYLVVVYDQDN